MSEKWVRLDVADGVGLVTMDRPPVNALNREMRRQLVATFDAISEREDIRCAVLTGTGHEGQIYNITGPDRQSFAEVTAIMADITGIKLTYVPLEDAAQYAMFDAMGIPRRPVDDQSVNGIPWNSDDMVSFGRAIREGFLDICTDDVHRLTGRRARSVRQMIAENVEMLRAAATA